MDSNLAYVKSGAVVILLTMPLPLLDKLKNRKVVK